MRKSNRYSKIMLLVCFILSIVLMIPKVTQMEELLRPLLSFEEFNFFVNNRAFFIFLIFFLEFVGSVIAIVVLKYLYILAKVPMTLTHNALIFLSTTVASRLIGLAFTGFQPHLAGILTQICFAFLFLVAHYLYHDKDKLKPLTWIILSVYPLFNMLSVLI